MKNVQGKVTVFWFRHSGEHYATCRTSALAVDLQVQVSQMNLST